MIVESCRAECAQQLNIRPDELEYIGDTDCSMLPGRKKGDKLVQFKIKNKNHPRFQSIAGFKSWEL